MTARLEDDQNEMDPVPEAPVVAKAQAARDLLPLVYGELRRLAAKRLAREAPGQTLQATALVHEAYLRLVGGDPDRPWDGRAHFFAAAAEAMRRSSSRTPAGGNSSSAAATAPGSASTPRSRPLPKPISTCWPWTRRSRSSPLKTRSRRSWSSSGSSSGVSLAESAEILGTSTKTADRYWAYARAWLMCEINGRDANGPE